MIFNETKLKGAYIIKPEKIEDERGFFTRTWDKKKFQEKELDANFVQNNVSFNKKKGTIRGMHYQIHPYEEIKLIRCTRGRVFNVIIDLRSDSKTYKQWDAVELNQDNHLMRYVPKGFANGIQTLEDNTEIFYQMSQFYEPKEERGIRWDDPVFNIKWPEKVTVISKKDLSFKPSNDF